MSKAVILAEGKTLFDYNESEHKDAFVQAVNTAIHTYKSKKRKFPRTDLVIAMDAPRHFNRTGKLENMLSTPETIPMRLQSGEWRSVRSIVSRENVSINPSSRIRVGDVKNFWKHKDVNGSTTAIAAIYHAIKLGHTEIYTYGHDFTEDWYGFSPTAAKKTIREINFAHSLVKEKGGFVAVSEGSHLWDLEYEENGSILRLECEKAKKKRKKKAETTPKEAE